MATTVRQLVTRAFRYLGLASEGIPAPLDYDADVGLQALKGLYLQFIAGGAFGVLTDVLTDADYDANENERVINSSAGSIVVTNPTTITESGVTRAPYDRSVIIVAGGSTFLYDADLAGWQTIETLTLNSTAPLAQRYGTALAALLAASLAPEYQTQLSPIAVALADEGARALRITRQINATIDPGLRALTWRTDVFDITTDT
jgi:hypothetical protein